MLGGYLKYQLTNVVMEAGFFFKAARSIIALLAVIIAVRTTWHHTSRGF